MGTGNLVDVHLDAWRSRVPEIKVLATALVFTSSSLLNKCRTSLYQIKIISFRIRAKVFPKIRVTLFLWPLSGSHVILSLVSVIGLASSILRT